MLVDERTNRNKKLKKMFYLLFGLILLLFILFLTGRKSVHHEIIIHSDTETVWNVIINMEEYPNWNPVMELLEGTLIQGNQVKYLLTPDENTAIEVRATIAQLTAEKILKHTGGNRLVFSFRHVYLVEEINETVKVTIHEDYRGIAVNFWNIKPIEKAYERLNYALKERSEHVFSTKAK